MENISIKWFNLVTEQLINRHEFSDNDLYFFEIHTIIDIDHGNILKEVLLPLLKNDKNRALFKNGSITAALIWKNFYDAISQEMQQLNEL